MATKSKKKSEKKVARLSPPKSGKTPPNAAQVALPGLDFKKQLSFGGSLLKNSHAKVARPLSSKQALHIVLRSEHAQGARSMLKSERVIQNMLLKQGRKHGVKVYRVANAGNHLHLLVRFTKRRGLQNFLRGSTGLIARKIMGRERGAGKLEASQKASTLASVATRSPITKSSAAPRTTSRAATESFWSQRPFTRIVSWGRDFDSTLAYVKLNTLESLGFISRKFTRALPTQEIRNKVLNSLSLALTGIDITSIRRAPSTG